jgi:hypothetical protein
MTPGRKPFDDDVGPGRELPEDFLPLRRFQVEAETPLVAVDEGERLTPLRLETGVAARVGRLDLEDVGAHVREHHPGHLGRRHARQLEDLDAVEHSHGLSPLASGGEDRAEALTPRLRPGAR